MEVHMKLIMGIKIVCLSRSIFVKKEKFYPSNWLSAFTPHLKHFTRGDRLCPFYYRMECKKLAMYRYTLIKKKIKFSSYLRKFRMEHLQSRIWRKAYSSYMVKYLRISSYIWKPFLIYDFATSPIWISLHMREIWFFFISVPSISCRILLSTP